MQNLKVVEYGKQAALLIPDSGLRRAVLPTIVGLALGSFLPVKQGNELNPLTTYADTHTGNVGRVVSYLNETLILNTDAALEAARSMYILRHRILNGEPTSYMVNPEIDFVDNAVGLAPLIPLEVYNAIKKTGLSGSKLLSFTKNLIADLKATGQITL